MSEKTIIMSTPMVQAILGGRKTQTRRVIKPQPTLNSNNMWVLGGNAWKDGELPPDIKSIHMQKYMPYQPNSVLWMRETWAFDTGDDDEYGEGCYVYKADNGEEAPLGRWHPSIHMPRAAARIFLRVTGVRVERVQDISEDDARAEGVDGIEPGELFFNFISLWDSLNAKRGYGWESNPWVWVISFERVNDYESNITA